MQIFVLDAESRDATAATAREWGARVETRHWEGFVGARRHALAGVRTPWTLMLDADELIDEELRAAILAAREDADGYRLRRVTLLCGRPVRTAGWSGERLLRLFRTDRARVEPNSVTGRAELHERWLVDGPVEDLAGTLVHDSYPTLASYRAKFARYTDIEAAAIAPSRRALLRAFAVFPARSLGDRAPRRLARRLARTLRRLEQRALSRHRAGEGPARRAPVSANVALDVRETSHMSAGMRAYLRALRTYLPRVAPELRIAEIGRGDNFDLAEQVALPLALARLRPRLVHFPTPFVPRVVPAPAIVTVHDLIDLEFPQYAKRKVGPYWRFVVAPVLRAARAVITDDARTVGALERFAGVDPRRVRVIPLGVDAPAPLPEPMRREGRTFLRGEPPAAQGSHDAAARLGVAPADVRGRSVLTGDEDAALRAPARGARAASWSSPATSPRRRSGGCIAARRRMSIPRCAKASVCRCSRRCARARRRSPRRRRSRRSSRTPSRRFRPAMPRRSARCWRARSSARRRNAKRGRARRMTRRHI